MIVVGDGDDKLAASGHAAEQTGNGRQIGRRRRGVLEGESDALYLLLERGDAAIGAKDAFIHDGDTVGDPLDVGQDV